MTAPLPAHSKIGASSYYRWKLCPGSVRLCATVPNVESEYAKEGTRAHELAEALLRCASSGNDGADVTFASQLLETAPPDMLEAVQVYVEAIMHDYRGVELRGGKPVLFIEHRFDLSKLHPGLFGTSDAALYDPVRKYLYVYDYKHGAGVAVDVLDRKTEDPNPQLMYYGLGGLETLGLLVNTVDLVIVQPRCPHPDGPVRRCTVHAMEFFDFAADLVEAAKRTEDPKAPLVPGDKQCGFCSAKGICPALAEQSLEVAKSEFKPTSIFDPKRLGELLERIPLLEAFIKGVREYAYQEALKGRLADGWKLVQKRPTRRWRLTEEETKASLQKDFGLSSEDIVEQPSLKSPAQVEKLLKGDLKKQVGELTISESSGYTLKRTNEPGEPIKLDAQTEFDIFG